MKHCVQFCLISIAGLIVGWCASAGVNDFIETVQAKELVHEQEVLTWSHTDEEPPEAVWYYDGETTHRYLLCKLVEPNEPVVIDPFDTAQNADWPYYKCPDCKMECDIRILHICPGEPNEPELLYSDHDSEFISIVSPTEYVNRLFHTIPTWPDYIELEKELVIHCPNDIYDIGLSTVEFESKLFFSKGTKIYFKDD